METMIGKVQNRLEHTAQCTGNDTFTTVNQKNHDMARSGQNNIPFHVMAQFYLESLLREGKPSIEEFTQVLNSSMKAYLKVFVPNDSEWCMKHVNLANWSVWIL